MEISDSRAFRPHLRGLELDRAQEKFLATVLRSPGLWSSAARSKIGRHHFSVSLRPIFDLATGVPEKIRAVVVSGNNPQVRMLLGVPVHLHHGVVLSLARQIICVERFKGVSASVAWP